MINRFHIEISVFSLDAAIKAAKAGADRLELCSGPSEGGTTPPFSLIKAVCQKVNIPVYPIIRPQGGGFCYSDEEFEMMKEDILNCKTAGCSGIATGILNAEGKVDTMRLQELVERASPMSVTFIRAFDLVPKPQDAIEEILAAGCERILTSGQAPYATDALPLLQSLREKANGRISIMPGSGINNKNLQTILENTEVCEIHASARIAVDNENPAIDHLGFGQKINCNPEQIREMRQIADQWQKSR
ncbi:MAG: copper homeostasis protein CutC [Bacteroidota bacterium]